MQYKSDEVNQQVRKKQFNMLDFFSYVGGILGLFAGFSALSFVEIIYWFTMRCFMRNYRKRDVKIYPIIVDQESSSKLFEFIESFLSESSIHGLAQIFEFSWTTGLIWIFFITTSLTFCFHLILSTQANSSESRVIAYDDNFKDVKDVSVN